MGTGGPTVPPMISSTGTQHKYSLDIGAVSPVTKPQYEGGNHSPVYLRKARVTL
jgi:hypothetical protein